MPTWTRTDHGSHVRRFGQNQTAAVVKSDSGGWDVFVDGAPRRLSGGCALYGWTTIDGYFRTRREAIEAADRIIQALGAQGTAQA